jgi:hypothetical protein
LRSGLRKCRFFHDSRLDSGYDAGYASSYDNGCVGSTISSTSGSAGKILAALKMLSIIMSGNIAPLALRRRLRSMQQNARQPLRLAWRWTPLLRFPAALSILL